MFLLILPLISHKGLTREKIRLCKPCDDGGIMNSYDAYVLSSITLGPAAKQLHAIGVFQCSAQHGVSQREPVGIAMHQRAANGGQRS